MFEVVDVTDWLPVGDEPMGTMEKDWLRHPDGDRWLFKQQTRGHAIRDCTEKIAAELAALLGVPHADVELAQRAGVRGVIVRRVLPEHGQEEIVHGNSLLARVEPTYQQSQKFHTPEHTVGRVVGVLTDGTVSLPRSFPPHPAIRDARDLFVGYLLFDAWVVAQLAA